MFKKEFLDNQKIIVIVFILLFIFFWGVWRVYSQTEMTLIGENVDIYGDLTVGGNVQASNNIGDNCETLGWTCTGSQECPAGKFVTAVSRNTGGALCGVSPSQWYQMSITCCEL